MSRTRRWFSSAALASAVALLALGSPAGAASDGAPWMQPTADYVAHTVMEADGGRLTGRVWASGPKERRELSVRGRTHDVILRRDRGVTWILMPEQRMYLEQPLGESPVGNVPLAGARLEREALGAESVNGAEATKYRVHGTAADGAPFEGTMWMTDEEIPVRIVTGQGPKRVHMELDRLSVGFVDPGRFEIPRGYTRFELPGPARADLENLRQRHGEDR